MSYGERPYWDWTNQEVIKQIEKGFRYIFNPSIFYISLSIYQQVVKASLQYHIYICISISNNLSVYLDCPIYPYLSIYISIWSIYLDCQHRWTALRRCTSWCWTAGRRSAPTGPPSPTSSRPWTSSSVARRPSGRLPQIRSIQLINNFY